VTDAAAVAAQIVVAWSALAADTSALDGAPDLHQPGGRDWASVLLTERFRAGIGAGDRAGSGAGLRGLLQTTQPA
jgi:hypothetical protein